MATLKEVATHAGVGLATVSRVFRGTGPVSAEAVARVRAAAEQLGYRPCAIARALATQAERD
jgi:LacI family transcriptional regulator